MRIQVRDLLGNTLFTNFFYRLFTR